MIQISQRHKEALCGSSSLGGIWSLADYPVGLSLRLGLEQTPLILEHRLTLKL